MTIPWHGLSRPLLPLLAGTWLALVLALTPVAARAALTPAQLAVVVNDADPASVEIGEYYRQKRGISEANLIHVRLIGSGPNLTPALFAAVRARILSDTPFGVQAYALAWTRPYRVDCMSITSALTFGYDPAWCSRGDGCHMTRDSPLFRYRTHAPFDDLGIRPSMMLAGSSVGDVKELIDRGVRADGSQPKGSAWLLVTGDRARNSRLPAFLRAATFRAPGLEVHLQRGERLPPRDDVLFYFVGAASVPGLRDVHFLPGAVGDHLTSFGGMLTDSPQMSALRWLEAGATGSYGTVREPCNYAQKFPDPDVLMHFYVQGETLIEAYWKSVSSPGEGVFIGEPLARPWE